MVEGSAEIHLDCEPAFDYGGLASEWRYSGVRLPRGTAVSEGMELELSLVTDMRLGFEGPRAKARSILREGDVAFVALGWSQHPLPATYEEASDRLGLRRTTGRTGSSTAPSPITPGAPICSAAR